jgi:hypothetical protein
MASDNDRDDVSRGAEYERGKMDGIGQGCLMSVILLVVSLVMAECMGMTNLR